MKVVAASGYMDPLHSGHIEYLEKARALGDKLVVILNNDEQAIKKKGFCFMNVEERKRLILSLKCVDEVFVSIDKDRTVCASLEAVKPDIFAKGGDQNVNTIPEADICRSLNIQIVDGLGDKIQSSRWLLRNLKDNLKNIDQAYLDQVV